MSCNQVTGPLPTSFKEQNRHILSKWIWYFIFYENVNIFFRSIKNCIASPTKIDASLTIFLWMIEN